MRGGGSAARLSVFFSIVRHAKTQHRKPAPRGMASQHGCLREGYISVTCEIMYRPILTKSESWSHVEAITSFGSNKSECLNTLFGNIFNLAWTSNQKVAVLKDPKLNKNNLAAKKRLWHMIF